MNGEALLCWPDLVVIGLNFLLLVVRKCKDFSTLEEGSGGGGRIRTGE